MTGAGPNRSAAVMAQRVEPHDSLDFFPTPPWAGRAFCEALAARGWDLSLFSARDPACGTGDLAVGLRDHFRSVQLADIHDHRAAAHWHRLPDGGATICDFLMPATWSDLGPVDWIVTNPPFRLAESFVNVGLAHARRGVAMLVRTAFLEGEGRFDKLFAPTPPSMILQFAGRVVMAKGALRDPDKPYMRVDAKTGRRARAMPSSATAYVWLIWFTTGSVGMPCFGWIPARARQLLTRPGDYPPLAPEEAVPADDGALL